MMPWKTNAELPDWVKKNFSEEVQTDFRNTFNSALKQYNGDEGKAMATAIAMLKKKGYHKKGDKWIKAEAGYVKDLGLTPGEYDHPNKPGEKLKLTLQDLEDYVKYSDSFLNKGGDIPATIGHPKTKTEKVDLTEGHMLSVWLNYDEQKPYGYFVPLANEDNKFKQWVEKGKLKAVSPGIYHDVVTSAGKFPSLIDHVALTPDPFNLGQSGFIPINAEKFQKAYLFFENKYVSYDASDDIASNIADRILYNIKALLNPNSQKGGGDMDLEAAKTKIAELEAQQKKDQGEIASRDKTIGELQGKVEKYEKDEKERIEKEAKDRREKFEKRVNELVEKKIVQPKTRDELIKNFETLTSKELKLEFEGNEISVEDFLLARFEKLDPFKNKLNPKDFVVRIDDVQIDLKTEEGKEKLTELYTARAKEIAKEKELEDWHGKPYEQAMKEINEKYEIPS